MSDDIHTTKYRIEFTDNGFMVYEKKETSIGDRKSDECICGYYKYDTIQLIKADLTVTFVGNSTPIPLFPLYNVVEKETVSLRLFDKWYVYMMESSSDVKKMKQSICTLEQKVKKMKAMLKYAPPPTSSKFIEASDRFEQNKTTQM